MPILVPGAGLEPARTRQGPRDFKSQFHPTEQYSLQSNIQNARVLRFGVCACPLLVRGGLGTVTGTDYRNDEPTPPERTPLSIVDSIVNKAANISKRFETNQ